MKKGLTEIVCVIDKSGSMEAIRDDAIGGFNAFLDDQSQQPGEATMTLAFFDDWYDLRCEGVPLAEVPRLTRETYQPGGTTALLDAVGRTVARVEQRLEGTPPEARPERVVVAILTDGQENASRVFNKKVVFQTITRLTDLAAWHFIFLAANQDAIQEGASLGVGAANSVDFAATSQGTLGALCTMSHTIADLRSRPPR